MRRQPNLAISGWFRQNAIWNAVWVIRASCGARQDLPWISDVRPTLEEHVEMHAICRDCPVISRCANYALNSNGGRGVDGGYYAGTWLPWPVSAESPDTKLLRSRARRQLKSMIRPRYLIDA